MNRKVSKVKDVDNFFYKLRIKKKLSQEDFAHALGVTQSNISKLEAGKIDSVSKQVLFRLRSEFKVNINKVIDSGVL